MPLCPLAKGTFLQIFHVRSTWVCPPMNEFLSYPYDFQPRQDPKVWQEYNRCALPSQLKDFIHQALWAELPVGERHASWKPLEVTCPLDGLIETSTHALFLCRFVDTALQHVVNCFPNSTEGPQGLKQLLDKNLAESFRFPNGVLAWIAIYANWRTKNIAKSTPQAKITDNYFFQAVDRCPVPFSHNSATCYTIICKCVSNYLIFYPTSSSPTTIT